MSMKLVRAVAMGIFFAFAIPGMIVASISDNAGAAVTFGCIAAGVAVALIVTSAVTSGRLSPTELEPGSPPDADTEAQAEALEAHVRSMVRAGADEAEVRALIRTAMQLARRSAR